MRKSHAKQGAVVSVSEVELNFGHRREELRLKYASLSNHELHRLANETAVLAAALLALAWERNWSVPTGN